MNFVTSGAIKVGGAYRNDYSNHPTKWDEKGLTEQYFKEIQRISKNQIIFGANHFANILPNSRCWLVWDKRTDKKYNNDFADCELIWTSFNKPSRMIRFLWSGMLQGDMKNKEKRIHPTQKPVIVMREIIEKFTNENDLVLDPFLGGGDCHGL
jgi:site-specific DNA-methyltransferase (adenine-specific)